MKDWLKQELQASIDVKTSMLADAAFLQAAERMCQMAVTQYKAGFKMLIAGNGGSAADAQHIAGELVSRFYFNRPALPAVALTTDTSILTAIGNDYGYEETFARQVEALGAPGDILLVLSTSGNSPNILKAIASAKKRGLTIFGFTGEAGGKMAADCDVCIRIPSACTPRIQEAHILIGHVLCAYIEEALFGRASEFKNLETSIPKMTHPKSSTLNVE